MELSQTAKTMTNNSFCTFIISHGRPDKVITLNTLKRCGYTGPLFIVCDNEDKTVDQYKRNFGQDMVLVFDKIKYASMVDNCDNFQNRRTTTHARNACFDLAAEKGFEYFLVLDDDYISFRSVFDAEGNSTIWKSQFFPFNHRKAMNSFFCKTSRRFWFFSRLNEDVNTYLALGNRGRIFMTMPEVQLTQAQTQATAGGMSEAYLASGTYVKSFYTVMICPSFAIATVTSSMKRMHHKISWNNAVPKIIDEAHKKQ